MEDKIASKNWDLSKVSNDLSLDELIDTWKAAAITECNLRKNAFKSLQNFKKWWFAWLRINSIDVKTRTIFREFENIKNPTDEQKDWMAEMERVSKEVGKKLDKLQRAYKLIIKNKKKVLEYVNKDPDLRKYKTTIQLDYLNSAGHQMSDENKKLKDETWGTNAINRVYEALKNDTIIDPIKDKNGKKVDGAKVWGDVTCSWDETVRKNAYISLHTLERKHRGTLTWIATVAASRANQTAKYHNYKNWIDQCVFENYQISLKDFYYIIDQCDKFAQTHIKYNSHNKKLIMGVYGIKDPKPWDEDLYITNTRDLITNEQAQKAILDGLACLGPDYVNKIKECYRHNIIKWDKKKVDGEGYCFSRSGELDEHPIRFNWDGSSISATTLAHELGHNINKKYVKANNEVNTDTNELLSEIPSIVNSILMGLHFIKIFKANPHYSKQELYGIYLNLLSYMFSNISINGYYMELADILTRYVIETDDVKPYDFEMKAYKAKAKFWGLTKAQFNLCHKEFPYWLDALRCYQPFISKVINGIDGLQYYVGSIVALVIADKIFKGDKKTLANYQKFLKAGTTVDQIKQVKTILGIDLLKPKVYTQAKQVLNRLVNDFINDIKI